MLGTGFKVARHLNSEWVGAYDDLSVRLRSGQANGKHGPERADDSIRLQQRRPGRLRRCNCRTAEIFRTVFNYPNPNEGRDDVERPGQAAMGCSPTWTGLRRVGACHGVRHGRGLVRHITTTQNVRFSGAGGVAHESVAAE